ncbi:MAG: class I SAM-dependent methyltransferase [Anaerolineales bacterium]
MYSQIAEQLPLATADCLLDVGTGSGLQLKVIHAIRPEMRLFGLDVSEASIRVARRLLVGVEVDLRVGNIENTSYPSNTFDIVTCHSSMSYWKNPILCLNEIHRILKPGGEAILFEPQKDLDIEKVAETIANNLADKSALRKWAAVNLNVFGLRWGRKFGLKLYSDVEFKEMAAQSAFGSECAVTRTMLLNLPIFVRIQLRKMVGAD